MSGRPLEIAWVTQVVPGPPRYGAQARMHGLMTVLGARHSLTALSLLGPSEDASRSEAAMRAHCREVILVPHARAREGLGKRLLQLRSLASLHSFERLVYHVPPLQRALDLALSERAFDVVVVESPFLAHYRLRQAPRGARPPRLVLDEHNVEYDVLRQVGGADVGLLRRVYNEANWRKLRVEEHAAWRRFDGVALTSAPDRDRVLAAVPSARTAVVPNAVDVDHYRPRAGDPPPDGRTVLFFGAIHYFPNTDGILHFLRETWPRLAASHPRARLKIVGPRPPPSVLQHRGPRVDITGFVEDLRPHLAEAAAVVVPLRMGGGTRLKILEAMAMAKPIVSTRLGAEGIEASDGRELLLADEPGAFAAAVGRVLDEPDLAARLGQRARELVSGRYSWAAAGGDLERLFREVCAVAG